MPLLCSKIGQKKQFKLSRAGQEQPFLPHELAISNWSFHSKIQSGISTRLCEDCDILGASKLYDTQHAPSIDIAFWPLIFIDKSFSCSRLLSVEEFGISSGTLQTLPTCLQHACTMALQVLSKSSHPFCTLLYLSADFMKLLWVEISRTFADASQIKLYILLSLISDSLKATSSPELFWDWFSNVGDYMFMFFRNFLSCFWYNCKPRLKSAKSSFLPLDGI